MSLAGIGSVCSGFGGLDMAVEDVFEEAPAWFFEFEKAPSKVLAHHWPEVPNYGDLTAAQWAELAPVRIIAGGTPCQDLSAAGKRKGMSEGTRSNLWVQMREGIATLRPEYVVWENVRGAYSARADSEVEREEGLLGGSGNGSLRALGRVLGDLSSLGYDCRWVGLPASAVGAAHPRFRVFVLATDSRRGGGNEGEQQPDGREEGRVRAGVPDERAPHAPTHADTEGERWDTQRAEPTRLERGHSPHSVAAGTQETTTAVPDAGSSRLREHSGGSPAQEAWAIASDLAANPARPRLDSEWGPFADAIEQWERIMGRRAPSGTVPTGRDGKPRANPEFGEWLMGAPAGHITDPSIGLSWADQWTAIGNGVVRQQADYALRYLRSLDPQPHNTRTTEGKS